MTLARRHAEEFHGIPIMMWKSGKCTEVHCGKKAIYAVHFKTGDSLPYCMTHSISLVREPHPYDIDKDRVLGAYPIDVRKYPKFGAVPDPPQIVYPMTETPRLETPEEWRSRLAREGTPIPDPGDWEISKRGIY